MNLPQTIIGRYTLYKWDEPVLVSVRVDARHNQKHYLGPQETLIEANCFCDDGIIFVFTAHGIHRYIWRTQRHEGPP